MKRRMIWVSALAVCMVFYGATASRAAENVLSVVPDGVLGVVTINNVQQANGKIARLAEQMQQPVPDLLALARMTSGLKEGVDPQGTLALAVLLDSDISVPILFVPTNDYAALVKQLGADDADADVAEVVIAGKEAVVGKKGGYAVLVERDHRDTLDTVLASTKSLAAVTAGFGDFPTENDVFAVATPAGIEMAKSGALMGLAIAKKQLEQAGPDAEAAVAGLELYEKLFQSLDKEIACLAAGLQVRPDGSVQLSVRSLLTETGQLTKLAQHVKPAPDGPLAGLPKAPFAFVGGGPFPHEWIEPMMDLSIDMMKAYPGGEGITDEVAEKLARLSAESAEGLRSMSMMFASVQPGRPLYSGVVIAIKTDDAQKYMETYERTVKKMQKLGAELNHPMFSYSAKKIKIGDVDGLKLTMDMAGIMAAQQVPDALNMMEAMFGEGGELSIFLAPIDENTVLGTYVSKRRLVQAIRAAGDPEAALANNPGIRRTAKMLPAGAQWVGYWSPRGTLQFAKAAVAAITPEAEADIPEFPATPPIGFAMKLTPQIAQADVVVPAAVLKAAAEVFKQAQGESK